MVAWERQIGAMDALARASPMPEASLAASLPPECAAQVHLSTMVLRVHQDKTFPGAMVASLSVPWGNTREEREGYHLVWPRDLCESAGALLAVGATREAHNTLTLPARHADRRRPLEPEPVARAARATGRACSWMRPPSRCCWPPRWRSARRSTAAGSRTWSRARWASSCARARSSDQDRWEEDAGLNTFTLAACICALVAGARFLADGCARARAGLRRLLELRSWRTWTSVRDTPLARLYGVPGYYVRVAPGQALTDDRCPPDSVLPIRNLQVDPGLPASAQVAVDFLQLVRFGLRRADDPLILATVKVADALLKVDTPAGPCWHRYNEDGYGEHDDGSAYDGTGRGRAWPLLTGERGHYELCAGRDPLPYLEAMTRMASAGGMLPEQVWDAAPIRRAGPESRAADRGGDAAGVGARGVPEACGLAAAEATRSTARNRCGSATTASGRSSPGCCGPSRHP